RAICRCAGAKKSKNFFLPPRAMKAKRQKFSAGQARLKGNGWWTVPDAAQIISARASQNEIGRKSANRAAFDWGVNPVPKPSALMPFYSRYDINQTTRGGPKKHQKSGGSGQKQTDNCSFAKKHSHSARQKRRRRSPKQAPAQISLLSASEAA